MPTLSFQIIFISTIFMSYCLASPEESRNLLQFSNMINAVTTLSAFYDFNGYGCWCGAGGYGDPVDEVDACCKKHDECYDHVEKEYGCSPKIFNIYNYDANLGSATCKDSIDTCNYRICQCDKEASECFYKNLDKHNKANIFWKDEKFKVCKCPAGTVNSNDECIKCPSGYYNDKEGQISLSSCIRCKEGYDCSSQGTVTPRICPKGTYEYKNACYNCPVGYYQPIEGGSHNYVGLGSYTYCKYCPEGYICPKKGLAAPTQICPSGTYAYKATTCVKCPKGYYSDSAGATRCKSCPQGYNCLNEGTVNPTAG